MRAADRCLRQPSEPPAGRYGVRGAAGAAEQPGVLVPHLRALLGQPAEAEAGAARRPPRRSNSGGHYILHFQLLHGLGLLLTLIVLACF